MSLKALLKTAIGVKEVITFQQERQKETYNNFDKWLFKFIRSNRLVHELFFGWTDLVTEYVHRDPENRIEILGLEEYSEVEGNLEYAIAPHILGRQEISAQVIFASAMPGSRFVYALSKVENLEETLKRVFLAYLGAFPIDRGSTSKKQVEFFYLLVDDPSNPVGVFIHGTRVSSGIFEDAYQGLERSVKHSLNNKGKEKHTIIPVSNSFDVISRRFFATGSDPIYLTKEDFEKDKGMYGQKGSLTKELETITSQAMKVTYNHIATTHLLHLVTSTKYNNNLVEINERQLREGIEEIIQTVRKDKKINLDEQTTTESLLDDSFEDFLSFCFNNGILITRNGVHYGDLGLFSKTFDKYNQDIKKKYETHYGENSFDNLSQSEQNHKTKRFRKIYPMQYMANMVKHLNLLDYLPTKS